MYVCPPPPLCCTLMLMLRCDQYHAMLPKMQNGANKPRPLQKKGTPAAPARAHRDLGAALSLLRSPLPGAPALPPPEVVAAAEALSGLVEGLERHQKLCRARGRVAPEDRAYFRVHPKVGELERGA
jgi:hypothetical protein